MALLPVKDSSSESSFAGDHLRFREPGSSSSVVELADFMLANGKEGMRTNPTKGSKS